MTMIELSESARTIFNTLAEGVLVIDIESRVVFANDAYLNFLRMTHDEVIGRKLRDFRPHAQLPTVVESGKAVLHAQRLEGLEEAYFVNMYPLRKDGAIIGGISIITFMSAAEQARAELEKYKEKTKYQALRQATKTTAKNTFEGIVAVAPKSIAIRNLAEKLAKEDLTILLQSESGTGKELYAQSIHNASPRRKEVFLTVNCANFDANILDNELFGYVDHAFTGAKTGGKVGLFEAARGGTLFLDEISEMDIGIQAKLLRAIQQKKIRPLGSIREVDIDVRVVCACNADLEEYVKQGKFRKDLYYLLSTFEIRIPPLRERIEDIPALIQDILMELNHKLRRTITIAPDAMDCLMQYDWPGNVRELRNVIEFSAYMCDENTIVMSSLPMNLIRSSRQDIKETLSQRVHAFERGEIEQEIRKYGNTLEGKKKAAQALGISLASLYNKMGRKDF